MEKCGTARQVTDIYIVRRMRIARWIPKATNTHTQYLIFTAVPIQQLSHGSGSKLNYTYSAFAVVY